MMLSAPLVSGPSTSSVMSEEPRQSRPLPVDRVCRCGSEERRIIVASGLWLAYEITSSSSLTPPARTERTAITTDASSAPAAAASTGRQISTAG